MQPAASPMASASSVYGCSPRRPGTRRPRRPWYETCTGGGSCPLRAGRRRRRSWRRACCRLGSEYMTKRKRTLPPRPCGGALDVADLVHAAVVFDDVAFLDVVSLHSGFELGIGNWSNGMRDRIGSLPRIPDLNPNPGSISAPSASRRPRRMVSPFKYRRVAEDVGDQVGELLRLARRDGNGIERRQRSLHVVGMPSTIGVQNTPGAMVSTRMPKRASSRAIGNVMPTTPPFEADTRPARSGLRRRRPTPVLTITPRSPSVPASLPCICSAQALAT